MGVGDVGIQKYRGIGIGRFLIEMVKCYTYGVSTKSKSDLVVKTSSIDPHNFFTHIGFQRMETEDNLRALKIEFDEKSKCI